MGLGGNTKDNFNNPANTTTQDRNRSNPHQHYFSLFKPIRSINVYHGSNSFSSIMKVKGLMSVVECEGCGIQFISTTQQYGINTQNNDNKADENFKGNEHKRKNSVEETLAAYYNTSQLVSSGQHT